MALGRCEICGCPKDTKRSYPYPHKRISGVGGRVFCTARNCSREAEVVWLTEAEEQRYLDGLRVFRVPYSRYEHVA